jgi:enterochelin esterase-like enzyme
MPRKRAIWLAAGFVLLMLIASVVWLASLPRGTIGTMEYDSLGGKRRMLVYLPPGYSNAVKYPVLYLLHGAGDDETAWLKQGSANAILDRLCARNKIVPMIVVTPDCFVPADGGGSFEEELLQDVIPHVDSHYSTQPDREARAIAGCSLGGGRALSISLKHLDTFAWVGAFSPSLAGKKPEDLIADRADARTRLKLLWISCSDEDPLLDVSKSLHDALEEKQVPHVWHIGSGGHEWAVWKEDLRLFAQRLFQE